MGNDANGHDGDGDDRDNRGNNDPIVVLDEFFPELCHFEIPRVQR